MPSCKEIATAVSSGEIESAGLWRRLAIRLHMLICKHCREYVRQIGLLGDTARRAADGEQPDADELSEIERRVLASCGEAAGAGDGGTESDG
jgi:hypothetical protein